jgi:hypothetical protein
LKTTTAVERAPEPAHVHVYQPDPVDVATGVGTAVGLGAVGLVLSELFPPLAIPLLGLSFAGKRSPAENTMENQHLAKNSEGV